jgi:hypothetical protein
LAIFFNAKTFQKLHCDFTSFPNRQIFCRKNETKVAWSKRYADSFKELIEQFMRVGVPIVLGSLCRAAKSGITICQKNGVGGRANSLLGAEQENYLHQASRHNRES